MPVFFVAGLACAIGLGLHGVRAAWRSDPSASFLVKLGNVQKRPWTGTDYALMGAFAVSMFAGWLTDTRGN